MPDCAECVLLLRRHADAVFTHEELRQQLRTAVLDGKNELVTGLILAEAAALRERNQAEAAYRLHGEVAHGGGKTKGGDVGNTQAGKGGARNGGQRYPPTVRNILKNQNG